MNGTEYVKPVGRHLHVNVVLRCNDVAVAVVAKPVAGPPPPSVTEPDAAAAGKAVMRAPSAKCKYPAVGKHCSCRSIRRCFRCCCCLVAGRFAACLRRLAVLSTQPRRLWLPSVLWRCWVAGRKGIRPLKTEWWGTGVVICLERGTNDLHMVQLMPLPPHHLLLH